MSESDNKNSKNVLLEALKKKREKQGLGVYGDEKGKAGKKDKSNVRLKPTSSVSSSIGHRPTGR